MTMESDQLRQAVADRGPWFHNLHLPGGVQTAPDHLLGDFPASKWQQIAPALPDDLSGQKVLDIGCNAGFYSIELAKRGASVLGIDLDDRYLDQARWAAETLKVGGIRFEKGSVYELPRFGRDFDIVLFMGVFYHLRHPLLALDLLAELEADLLVFQTLTRDDADVSALARDDAGFANRERLSSTGWPAMSFVETTFEGDPTNWWVPNHACVEALLRSAGFRVETQLGHEIYLCASDPSRAGWQDDAHQSAARIIGMSRENQEEMP